MIVFNKVSKSFNDGTVALDEVSFQIEDKEFVFLIGESGAGKTTVMKLLRRQIKPSKGVILIKDKDLTELSETEVPLLRREVAMCFQDFKILYDRTVFENVQLALEIAENEDNHEGRVNEALNQVGLAKKGNFFPVQLSGGELQRVGIARAIVVKPDVLLADEPTGNLDPRASLDILKLFKEINLAGTTIVVATHNAELVNKFKERVITLSKGKLVDDQKEGKYEVVKNKKK